MSIKFTNYPSTIKLYEYQKLTKKLVKQLLSYESVLSVYQMGSIKDPGISDLDLICVFKNSSENKHNVRKNLSTDEKKILTHGIFGVEEKYLSDAIYYNYISNIKHLGGKKIEIENASIVKNKTLCTQIALEYLLKMYITLDTQKTFKIVNLRSFLLLAKAISFDLKLLSIKEGRLHELVEKILFYRANWYDNLPSIRDLKQLFLEFHNEVELLLDTYFTEKQFYLPVEEININGYFKILRSAEFKRINRGITLPSQLKFLGKNYIKFQYRLNKFNYFIPYSILTNDKVIEDRFKFTKKLVSKNRKNFPSFYPISSSLPIF